MRSLPHDPEAEAALVGAMMLSERAIGAALEHVRAADLYTKAHRLVFEAAVRMYGRGEPVDAVTVATELERQGELKAAGGKLGLHELVEGVPMPGSAATYARIVADCASRRGLIEAAREIEAAAFAGEGEVDELTERAEDAVFRAGRRRAMDQIAAVEDLVFEYIGKLADPERAGVPTGFLDLDAELGGLQPGRLYVVAARPGAGKSVLVTNIARNFALMSRAVAMWSLEMSGLEIAQRLTHAEARVSVARLREPSVDEWSALSSGADTFRGTRFWIVDAPSTTVVDIRARARRMRATGALDLIIVDYLQLMSSPSHFDKRHEAIAEMSRSLKVLAKELEVPVIAVSQLNRDPERAKRRPQLSDLRESGAIEQDADVVLFIHREDTEESKGTAEVIVGKNRGGPSGAAVTLTFLAGETRFVDYAGGRP